MLKYTNYNIVFQEVPDEITLAINISNCPNRCPDCHSPWLREDIGELLSDESLSLLIDKYKNDITCVCFMGGDSDPSEVERLSLMIKSLDSDNNTTTSPTHLKTAWYSGKQELPLTVKATSFDYIKLGPYITSLGSLKTRTTNQRLFAVGSSGELIDITKRFWRE